MLESGGSPTYPKNYSVVQRVTRLARHLERQGEGRAPAPHVGYQPHKLSQRLSDETVTDILAAYQAGATTREVGQRFGLAHSSINKLLKQHGVSVRRRSPSPADIARATAMYEKGTSTLQIANTLGYGASTVSRALRQAGVFLRSPYRH